MLLPQKIECKSFLIFLEIIFLRAVLVLVYSLPIPIFYDRGLVLHRQLVPDERWKRDRPDQGGRLLDNPMRVQTSKSGFDSS